jgi:hypothetical protein
MRLPSDIDFVQDEYVQVIADTAEDARRFFGAPDDWPVKFLGFSQHRKGRVWGVKSDGLVIF